jgi:hypothetical protein
MADVTERLALQCPYPRCWFAVSSTPADANHKLVTHLMQGDHRHGPAKGDYPKRRLDDASRSLVGHTIWNVAEWLEAHDDGEPYEIFSPEKLCGYRLTIERLPYREPVALAHG